MNGTRNNSIPVYPILLTPCMWEAEPSIACFQMHPGGSHPLSSLNEHQQTEALVTAAKDIAKRVSHKQVAAGQESDHGIDGESDRQAPKGDNHNTHQTNRLRWLPRPALSTALVITGILAGIAIWSLLTQSPIRHSPSSLNEAIFQDPKNPTCPSGTQAALHYQFNGNFKDSSGNENHPLANASPIKVTLVSDGDSQTQYAHFPGTTSGVNNELLGSYLKIKHPERLRPDGLGYKQFFIATRVRMLPTTLVLGNQKSGYHQPIFSIPEIVLDIPKLNFDNGLLSVYVGHTSANRLSRSELCPNKRWGCGPDLWRYRSTGQFPEVLTPYAYWFRFGYLSKEAVLRPQVWQTIGVWFKQSADNTTLLELTHGTQSASAYYNFELTDHSPMFPKKFETKIDEYGLVGASVYGNGPSGSPNELNRFTFKGDMDYLLVCTD